MNSPHRIALKAQWHISICTDPAAPTVALLGASRTFHRPTGLTKDQVIHFRFQPAHDDVAFYVNGDYYPINIANGLASATITDIMQETTRVEIRWRFHSDDASSNGIPKLPEHFAAWLEISQQTAPN